jgi:hypothetical protein
MVRLYSIVYVNRTTGKRYAVRCTGKYSTVITLDRLVSLGYSIADTRRVCAGKYTG